MRFFITASGGVPLSNVRAGETPENPLNIEEIFTPNFIVPGYRLIFLPGRYTFPETLDLRSIPDTVLYGDGKFIIEDTGKLNPAIYLGSSSTVTGVRFKDCPVPLILDDGVDGTLVFNCFDYQAAVDLSPYQSFTAKAVSNCMMRNLTSYRAGRGIVVLKGTTLRNSVATGIEGVDPRPAYSGERLDSFENALFWSGRTVGGRFRFTMSDQGTFITDEILTAHGTNKSGGATWLAFARETSDEEAVDLSRGDRAILILDLKVVSGLVAQADTYRFTFGSPAGSIRFDLADTALSAGFNVLTFDLGAPTATVGAVDLADIRTIMIEARLVDSGFIGFGVDELQGSDSTVDADYNAAPLFEGYDVYANFKGMNGLDVDANPVPYNNPITERFHYSSRKVTYSTYLIGGERQFHLGALFGGAHVFIGDDPGHLRFDNHAHLGRWTNDETFFDSETNEPGADGIGLAQPIDENLSTINALNGETVNLADNTALARVRDSDDSKATTFDKNAGTLSEMGLSWDFSGSPIDGTGMVGLGGDYYIPSDVFADVLDTGLEIVVKSPGGQVSQTLTKEDLIVGQNTVEVIFASPEASSGTFDQTDIQTIELKLHVDNAVAFSAHSADHVYLIQIQGFSTGPVQFQPDGSILFDQSYLEAKVARAISEPMLIRNVEGFIRMVRDAIEDAANGTFINRTSTPLLAITRTVEVRFSEHVYSRYGAVKGAVARSWTPLSRVSPVPFPVSKGYVQVRITLWNRMNVPG